MDAIVCGGYHDCITYAPDAPDTCPVTLNFIDALAELDRFIVATFKPEEVVTARRSVI